MITITGRVVDEEGRPMTNVKVVALANWMLTKTTSDAQPVDATTGRFTLKLESLDTGSATAAGSITPSFKVRVVDIVGRQLSTDREVFATETTHELNDITVLRAEAGGMERRDRRGSDL